VWQHTVHRLRMPAVHSSRNLEVHIVRSARCICIDVSGALSECICGSFVSSLTLHVDFTDLCSSPLFAGRYEGQFIEHRKAQLQEFVNSVCRHPVLSQCEVWQHFITCTDEKQWKAGKRKAEKDELVGANYFVTLQVPERPLNITDVYV